MKVADLQDILSLVRQMLVSAGGKGAADLADFTATLDPFRDLTTKQLANELRKLTERPKPSGARKRGTLPPAEADALIADVKRLYERAGNGSTRATEVDEETIRLDELPKADAVRAAESIGMKGMKNKSIGVIAGEIRKRIKARIGAGQRTGMIEVELAK